jgi:hypothetical protein
MFVKGLGNIDGGHSLAWGSAIPGNPLFVPQYQKDMGDLCLEEYASRL